MLRSGDDGGDVEVEALVIDEVDDDTEAKTPSKRRKRNDRRAAASAIDFDQFIGVDVQVRFTGSSASHQLSGGQQTVVAVALLMALQRCDPSPFYLFDEIDAALDPQYRTAVRNIIADQRESSQFVITTFHTEMIADADKYIAVRFENNVSVVTQVSGEQAVEIVRLEERTATRRR